MLVISNYKKGDTICVKVSTGEEIVGRFESMEEDIQVVKLCVPGAIFGQAKPVQVKLSSPITYPLEMVLSMLIGDIPRLYNCIEFITSIETLPLEGWVTTSIVSDGDTKIFCPCEYNPIFNKINNTFFSFNVA